MNFQRSMGIVGLGCIVLSIFMDGDGTFALLLLPFCLGFIFNK